MRAKTIYDFLVHAKETQDKPDRYVIYLNILKGLPTVRETCRKSEEKPKNSLSVCKNQILNNELSME